MKFINAIKNRIFFRKKPTIEEKPKPPYFKYQIYFYNSNTSFENYIEKVPVDNVYIIRSRTISIGRRILVYIITRKEKVYFVQEYISTYRYITRGLVEYEIDSRLIEFCIKNFGIKNFKK